MKPEKVFKRYDIRGKYPEEVDQEFAERLGKALGTFSRRNYQQQVVVGRDTKKSSKELKDAFLEGLKAAGIEVLDAGVGPTDYVAFTGMENAAVSVQVTSSHLPLNTNGFKFMYPEGNGFLNEDLYQVQDLFREKDFETGEGRVLELENPREAYFRRIDDIFLEHFDSIDRKIVVESMGGAAKDLLPELLENFGAEVIDLAAGRETPYINPPEPKPFRLEHMEKEVDQRDADLAVATDMDADRVAVFDGEIWLTGDELFSILANHFQGDTVASIDTSRAVEGVVEDSGYKLHYTRVGDPFVIDEALERGAALAGEPNGHYCFPELVPYNSGTLGALFFSAMDLEKELENVPEYYTEESELEVDNKEEKMASIIEEVIDSYRVVSDLDGIKFEKGDATVLVRPSGSSPIIRVKTESKSAEEAVEALEFAEEFVRNQ